MAKYIIDDELYSCSKKEALDVACSKGVTHVYIVGKSNHWTFTSGKWILAMGGCEWYGHWRIK